jgi:energy-converting hydrogenase B subunit D
MLATLVPMQSVALALVVLGAPAVVLTRDLTRLAVVNGFYGIVLALLFIVYGAPDVALSMIVVSGVAYPLILLVAASRIQRRRRGE